MPLSLNDVTNIIENLQINYKYEMLNIELALNKISATDIYAKYSLPNFNNSAMDGYGINTKDLNETNEFEINHKIFAGDNECLNVPSKKCCAIMTGAKVPSNVDAIIPKENVSLNNNKISLNSNIKKNQHIRFIGEDIKKDEILIKKNELIDPNKITLLASQGICQIKVYKTPKVSIFSSGNELKSYYEKIENSQIYNSNTPTLIAKAKKLGCDVEFLGQAYDSVESLKELIKNSLNSDLLITSGGVSVGDADFTKQSLDELGFETLFQGVEIKPGKPTLFGKINNTYILNLPGNPMASSIMFDLIGKLLISKLKGQKNIYHNFILAKLKNEFITKPGKTTLLPGFFDGEYFTISHKRSPGMVSVLSNCNGFIILDKNCSVLKENSIIKFIPTSWDFSTDIKKDLLNYE